MVTAYRPSTRLTSEASGLSTDISGLSSLIDNLGNLVDNLDRDFAYFQDLLDEAYQAANPHYAARELERWLRANEKPLRKAGKYEQLLHQAAIFCAIAGVSLQIAKTAPQPIPTATAPVSSAPTEQVQEESSKKAGWFSRFFNKEVKVAPEVKPQASVEVPVVIQENAAAKVSPSKKTDSAKLTALRRAIIGQESGGNFSIVNKDSGALGYGQIMPFNLEGKRKGWDWEILKENLTPQEFLKSPEKQIKIIDGKLNQYWQKQSVPGRSEEEIVRRVASTWYSGKPNRWNDTKPQFYGGNRYPSISKYTSSVFKRYQNELNPVSKKVVEEAMSWVGKSFRPGVHAQCANFVRHVFERLNIDVAVSKQPFDKAVQWNGSHPARAQSFFGSDIGKLITNKEDLLPGDLVAFQNTYGNWGKGAITHVGIYVGNGMIVDRSTRSKPVYHRPISTFKFAVGVRPHAYQR